MITWEQISNPQLDIVGIVAVLGEGSTTRNAQASALGWHHVLPRLLPAPQALLKHEHDKRLPTVPGTVVGAYSGNVKFELNFFCQLLHPDNLKPNQVELIEIRHRKADNNYKRMSRWFRKTIPKVTDDSESANKTTGSDETDDEEHDDFFKPGEQAYGVKKFGLLSAVSALGCCVSIGLIVGSICAQDGFALLATLLLSLTSTVVGGASWWRLDFKEDRPKSSPQKDRQKIIPDSDVVIYYPQGAFRIIRCTDSRCAENISRLYFRNEICEYVFGDNVYRVLALAASVFLMVGLLCMGNANLAMKIAFAASYIGLNVVYWGISALNPIGEWGHWEHRYECRPVPVILPSDPERSMTQSSLLNKPVISQLPIVSTSTDSPVNYATNIASAKFLQGVQYMNNQRSIHPNTARHRKNTSREDAPPSAGSPLDTFIMEESDTVEQITTQPQPATITVSPTEVSGLEALDIKLQATGKDEEARSQPTRETSTSTKQSATRLLNRYRLISKRTMDSFPDITEKPETFTTALWKAIAVTGTTRWLHQTHIAPDNEVWTAWIKKAGKKAETRLNQRGERVAACTKDNKGNLVLPVWGYQKALSNLFAEEADQRKLRPPPPRLLKVVEEAVEKEQEQHTKVKGITLAFQKRLIEQARKAQARNAAQRTRQVPMRRTSTSALSHPPRLFVNTENLAGANPVGTHSFRRRRSSDRTV